MRSIELVICFASLICTSTQQTCEDWNAIPEESYNQTFTEITSPDANEVRPLGFKTQTLMFEGDRPCIQVGDTGGNMRHIEVKWELQREGSLCVSNDADNTYLCSRNINFQSCSSVPGSVNSLTYTFYCEGDGCEGGDKIFWFRFVVESEMEGGGYDENWCSTRDSQYPSSLVILPSILPPTTTSTTNKAASTMLLRRKGGITIFLLLYFIMSACFFSLF